MKPVRTLYVCYFGLREPLVQRKWPFLRQLQSENVQVSLLTFEARFHENWTSEDIYKQRGPSRLKEYPALPEISQMAVAAATIYDMAVGTRTILGIMRREGIDILHAAITCPP